MILVDTSVWIEHLRRGVHDFAEALDFIETHELAGRGIGYIDVHLLASAALAPGTRLWTRDRRLACIAATLDLTI